MQQPQKLVAVCNDNEYKFSISGENEYCTRARQYHFLVQNQEDGFTTITVNGTRHVVEVASKTQNQLTVLVDGVEYAVTVETPFSLIRRKLLDLQCPPLHVDKVRAPMPGKILDVILSAGQVVNRGDCVLVLEAMKMQNSILAQHKGTVKMVCFKPGDTVSKDEVLVEIERC